jgi:hypothetical protein
LSFGTGSGVGGKGADGVVMWRPVF